MFIPVNILHFTGLFIIIFCIRHLHCTEKFETFVRLKRDATNSASVQIPTVVPQIPTNNIAAPISANSAPANIQEIPAIANSGLPLQSNVQPMNPVPPQINVQPGQISNNVGPPQVNIQPSQIPINGGSSLQPVAQPALPNAQNNDQRPPMPINNAPALSNIHPAPPLLNAGFPQLITQPTQTPIIAGPQQIPQSQLPVSPQIGVQPNLAQLPQSPLPAAQIPSQPIPITSGPQQLPLAQIGAQPLNAGLQQIPLSPLPSAQITAQPNQISITFGPQQLPLTQISAQPSQIQVIAGAQQTPPLSPQLPANNGAITPTVQQTQLFTNILPNSLAAENVITQSSIQESTATSDTDANNEENSGDENSGDEDEDESCYTSCNSQLDNTNITIDSNLKFYSGILQSELWHACTTYQSVKNCITACPASSSVNTFNELYRLVNYLCFTRFPESSRYFTCSFNDNRGYEKECENEAGSGQADENENEEEVTSYCKSQRCAMQKKLIVLQQACPDNVPFARDYYKIDLETTELAQEYGALWTKECERLQNDLDSNKPL